MGGWGFRIDYDQALEDDARLIYVLSAPETDAISRFVDALGDDQVYMRYARDYVLARKDGVVERAALLGVCGEDLACWLEYVEAYDFEGARPEETKLPKDWYQRAERVDAWLSLFWVGTSEERRWLLRKTKAALACHERNKARYGR